VTKMNVLIKIQKNPEQRFLVKLFNKDVIKRIQDFIDDGRRSNAIVAALLNAEFLKEISEDELPDIESDLILTEKHIYLNLL